MNSGFRNKAFLSKEDTLPVARTIADLFPKPNFEPTAHDCGTRTSRVSTKTTIAVHFPSEWTIEINGTAPAKTAAQRFLGKVNESTIKMKDGPRFNEKSCTYLRAHEEAIKASENKPKSKPSLKIEEQKSAKANSVFGSTEETPLVDASASIIGTKVPGALP